MFQTTLTVLQPLEDRLKECESIVNSYANLFFKQEDDQFIPMKRPPRSFSVSVDGTSRDARCSSCSFVAFALEIDKLDPTSELASILKRRKQIFLAVATRTNENDRNTVENLLYKPFQSNAYHDWVSQTTVEVLDVLDKVTRAQAFQVISRHILRQSKHVFFDRRISTTTGTKSFKVRPVNTYWWILSGGSISTTSW